MSLAQTLAAGPRPVRKGPGCTVGTVLRSLPEDESAALAVMLSDSAWESETVARTLRDEIGVNVQGQTVARHRRGGCSCEPR